MDEDAGQLVRAWAGAMQQPAVVAALEGLFSAATGAIAARGPACWASGRCCNFEQAGHRLYVTGLEAAYTLSRLPTHDGPLHELTIDGLRDARARGGCPFQVANLCGVHTIKPLACRVYFCDRSAQTWQQDVLERLIDGLKRLHDQHAIPYRYGEWRAMLEMFVREEVGDGGSPESALGLE